MKKIGMFLTFIILLFSPAFAKIHRVPCAFIATIQGGINVAKDGDTVLVMPGIYYENINFKGKKILVASKFIFDQDTNYIYNTIIDGRDTATVVTFNSEEDSLSSIQGFTIRHGRNNKGGGILCNGSSPRIAYNMIKENSARQLLSLGSPVGAGVGCFNSSPVIEYNNIIMNQSLSEDLAAGGGGIFCWGKGTTIIRFNLVIQNDVGSDGLGGGIFIGDSTVAHIHNNTIVNNYAGKGGGIIVLTLVPESRIFNNIIAFNSQGINAMSSFNRPTLAYNDFWGNVKGNFVVFGSEVGDTTWGFNRNGVPCDSFHNIIRDPLFVDAGNSDFNLLVSSPCIDAGDPDSPLDPDSTIADIGAFYYPHTPTLVKDDEQNLPQGFELSQNYPNPFNPTTTIPYTVKWFAVHG